MHHDSGLLQRLNEAGGGREIGLVRGDDVAARIARVGPMQLFPILQGQGGAAAERALGIGCRRAPRHRGRRACAACSLAYAASTAAMSLGVSVQVSWLPRSMEFFPAR